MHRREFLLGLFGGVTALALSRPLLALQTPARPAVVPLGSHARTIALAHGLPLLGDDVTAPTSLVFMGFLGGMTSLEETRLYRPAPGRAVVLMPGPWEGLSYKRRAREALSTLRAAGRQVDVVDVTFPRDPAFTFGDAFRLRENALVRQCQAALLA